MIYLDTNVFVHAALDRMEKGEMARQLLGLVEDGKVEAATSAVAFSELVFVSLKNVDREKAAENGEHFLSLDGLFVANLDRQTCRIALESVRGLGLRPNDALHYAAMKSLGIDEMVTEDRDFSKAKDIKKYSIKEFLKKAGGSRGTKK